jgi:hypothetical protein
MHRGSVPSFWHSNYPRACLSLCYPGRLGSSITLDAAPRIRLNSSHRQHYPYTQLLSEGLEVWHASRGRIPDCACADDDTAHSKAIKRIARSLFIGDHRASRGNSFFRTNSAVRSTRILSTQFCILPKTPRKLNALAFTVCAICIAVSW